MFTKKDITQTIMRLTRDRYGVYCNISKSTTFSELKFDKFDVLYMVMACEEYFGIHITQEEVGPLSDIKSLISLVITKLQDLGMITTEKVVPQNAEQEAKEALADAESNDGVPITKTEGDFEREEQEEELLEVDEEEKQPMNTVETEKVPADPPTPIIAEATEGA